jgi:PIN domain nuclease of toxin-antitoxin system
MSDGAVVLDASALLARLQREPGAERVQRALPGAAMSAANFSEVVAKLADRGMPADAIREALDGLDLDVRPFDTELAYAAGELRRVTRAIGLSLGDRACPALAARLNATALTSDQTRLGAQDGRTTVEVIR